MEASCEFAERLPGLLTPNYECGDRQMLQDHCRTLTTSRLLDVSAGHTLLTDAVCNQTGG